MYILLLLTIILQINYACGQRELDGKAKKNLESLLNNLPKSSLKTSALNSGGILPITFPIDIIYVIDASGSIGSYFSCVKESLQDLTAILNDQNELGLKGTNIGVVIYSDTPSVALEMRLGRSLATVQSTLSSLPFLGGATRTEKGLNLARRMFINAGRPNSYKLLVLITDGQSYPIDPTNVASLIKALGVEIYAIPVTDYVNIDGIKSVVSSPADDHIIETNNFCTLTSYIKKLKSSKGLK